MKLLKTLFLFPFLAQAAMAFNFNGVQSLEGLHTTRLFTASPDGIYYIHGYLNLPQGSNTGGQFFSKVIATISKNGTTQLYQGAAGASGFSIPQVSLSQGDRIDVALSSTNPNGTITGDGVINAVTGQVYFGSAF